MHILVPSLGDLPLAAILCKEEVMRVRPVLRYLHALALLSAPATPMHAQEKTPPSSIQEVPASPYPNTKEGLRLMLEDMRSAAKNGESDKLEVLITATEIPNCVAWLHKMYDSDKADSWEGMCDRKSLDADGKSSREALLRFASQEGEFLIRKVNDDPMPGRGLEWGWLQAIEAPLDIYFASWRVSGDSENSKGKPVAYFMFIDGGFRREGGITFFEAKPAAKTSNFVPPKLIKKVAPVYPPESASQHVTGTVRFMLVVGADGVVYNPRPISGEGLSDDPSLIQAARDAVLQWRYQPATLDGKPIQIEGIFANVTFALSN